MNINELVEKLENISEDIHTDEEVNRILTDIANKYLHISTLEVQGRDSLDFHDVAGYQLKKALMAAYNVGFAAGADNVSDKIKKSNHDTALKIED